jgi:hypothetical protein
MALIDEHVLAAYVDGSDLDAVAPALRAAFGQFADSGSWPSEQVLVVDQRQPADPEEPDFLPQWDLGLNLELDQARSAPNWFAGVEALVALLRQLAAETGREFVMFLCFRSQPWRQEYLTFVGPGPVDLAWLCGTIERLTRAGQGR